MSLGFGEFAVFLEGDALAVATKTRPSDQARIDELKKQNEDAKYMTKYTCDLEKFTPTKEKTDAHRHTCDAQRFEAMMEEVQIVDVAVFSGSMNQSPSELALLAVIDGAGDGVL